MQAKLSKPESNIINLIGPSTEKAISLLDNFLEYKKLDRKVIAFKILPTDLNHLQFNKANILNFS